MAGGLWWITSGGGIALTAATAKTSLGAKAHANSSIYAKRWRISFDGVTASAVPVLVEFCYITFATNSPGTNSTSVTPVQQSGRTTTVGWTAAKTWTAANEPTVVTVLEETNLTPNGGVLFYDAPLQDEPDTALGEGLGLRLTAPAAINVRLSMLVGRC